MIVGNLNAPVLVVCDAPSVRTWNDGAPISHSQLVWFARLAGAQGFTRDDFCFVGLCPPISAQDKNSASRKWAHVERHAAPVRQALLDANPQLVVTFGELASRVVLGRAVKITKVRGVAVMHDGVPVYPMLSPGFVERIPDHEPLFRGDMFNLAMIRLANYDPSCVQRTETNYEWCDDLSELLENRPAVISVDTETTGLRVWDPDVVPITVQITTEPGRALVCCVDEVYWRRWQDALQPHIGRFSRRKTTRLIRQLRELLEDPNVRKIGQNIKYDHGICRKLGIEVQGWLHDTQLMGFGVDENMLTKSLDDMVRVFVSEMSGYADDFNATYDKSDMRAVPPDALLQYAGADPDATYRLARVLRGILNRDERQWRVYRKIQLPAIQSFSNVVERHGLLVDKDKLRSFGEQVEVWLTATYRELVRMVPAAVRRRHMNAGKALTFSRADFVRDTLFGSDGLGLTPVVFTASTKDLPDAQKVASTSAKDHLPYFINDPRSMRTSMPGVGRPIHRALDVGDGFDEEDLDKLYKPVVTVGDFVSKLILFQKTKKLFGSFIGKEHDPKKGGPTGMWKYIGPDDRARPSYMMHNTNTGRTASRDPNGQNFPKRGVWAKMYRSIFKPTPGYKFVAADLSQIELRITAWMAQEPTMLRIYREGGDIHASTAAYVMGLTIEQFMALPDKQRDQKRFEAKSINFGFIYGMGWRKFMIYAKTDYGLDFTEEQAQAIRLKFFELYPVLLTWHDTMKGFVREHGYVRALHGSIRHLPSVYSFDEKMRAAAERYAVNSPVQRLGSDMGVMGLNRFCHQVDPDKARIIAFVHDQLVAEVREDCVDEMASALKWCMESVPLEEWFGAAPPIPIVADVEVGDDGGSMQKRSDTVAVKPEWWNDDEAQAEQDFLAVRRGVVHVAVSA